LILANIVKQLLLKYLFPILNVYIFELDTVFLKLFCLILQKIKGTVKFDNI